VPEVRLRQGAGDLFDVFCKDVTEELAGWSSLLRWRVERSDHAPVHGRSSNEVEARANPPVPPFAKGGRRGDLFAKGGRRGDLFAKGGRRGDLFAKGGAACPKRSACLCVHGRQGVFVWQRGDGGNLGCTRKDNGEGVS
jgi:hypothetical protein